MEIPGIGGSTSVNSLADRQLIADNLDTFLQLLTVQLRNQDPLEPLDTNEFTGQLVQFSQVEQAVKSNDLLEQIVTANSLSVSQTAVSYLGKQVTADGATTQFSNGNATWALNAADDAIDTTFTVRDANGAIIFTTNDSLDSGTSAFTWDGTTSTGQPAFDGLYMLTVNARNASNQSVSVSTKIQGTVRGVEFDGSEPLLDVGGIKVRMANVSSITVPE